MPSQSSQTKRRQSGDETVRGHLADAIRVGVGRSARRLAHATGTPGVSIPGKSGSGGQRRQHRSRHGHGDYTLSTMTNGSIQLSWGIADIAKRPAWPFDRGESLNLFEIGEAVSGQSQAAYGAFLNLLANFQPPIPDRDDAQQDARRMLIEFLREVRPTYVSLEQSIVAQIEAAHSTSSRKSAPTGDLRILEEMYLRIVTGVRPHIPPQELRDALSQTIDALAEANSDDRLAVARMIMADVLLISDHDVRGSAQMFALALANFEVPVQLTSHQESEARTRAHVPAGQGS
jgi:hypothetical protein